MNVGKVRTGALAAALAAAGLFAGLPANAGLSFFAGSLNAQGEFTPGAGTNAPVCATRYSAADVTLRDGRCEIAIEQTLDGPAAGAVDCVGLLPLTDGARAADVHADAGEGRPLAARVLEGEPAGAVLAAIAKATGNPAVLAFSGRPLLAVSGLSLGAKATVRVRWSCAVPTRDGLRIARCPMPADQFASRPVARATVTARIAEDAPLRAVCSPTHACDVARDGLRAATARVTVEHGSDGSDFQLCWVADPDPLGLRVLAHRPEEGEDGFFLLVGNPTGEENARPVPKDILFVLDISGSMRGEKMEQARSAIEYCLDRLNEGDRFNIVAFATEAQRFRDGLAARDARTIAAAKVFIDELVPAGRTNIGDALAAGLDGRPEAGRPRIMIFLTDGTPTAGEREPARILEAVGKVNTGATQVFVMGVGHDVNAHLLDKLAEATEGGSEYVEPEEEIDVKVAALYNRLSNPFLRNVTVDFGGLAVKSVFPAKLPALFRGSEVMVAGRYREGGKHTLRVRGDLHGQAREFACAADFPAKDEPAHEFIAPLWAARSIGFYLQQIRLHGENPELIEEVVRLSRRYGIVTEYTAFLADSKAAAMSDKDAAAEAARRMREANREQSGKWAFNQARNDQALQQRVAAASPQANTFVDRQGKVQEVANLRQVGRTAFVERDGRWEEAEEQGERKLRVVEQFSEEYFRLVRSNAKFAEAQRLGGLVTVNVGEERIMVK